jgi:hypothetical protein
VRQSPLVEFFYLTGFQESDLLITMQAGVLRISRGSVYYLADSDEVARV